MGVYIGGGGEHTHKDRNRSGINRVMTTIRDNNLPLGPVAASNFTTQIRGKTKMWKFLRVLDISEYKIKCVTKHTVLEISHSLRYFRV